MKLIAVMLLLAISLSSNQALASHELFPVGSKAVIVRIDDIQDYGPASSWYLQTEEMVLQHQIDANIPSVLAIIAANFGKQPQLIDQIRKGLDQGIFTLGIHGWTHTPYVGMSLSTQVANMQYAKDKLQSAFGIQVFTFIPPYDNFNDATIEAMKKNQLTVISSAAYLGEFPREQDGIMYIPETVTTANVNLTTYTWSAVAFRSIIQQMQDSWASYGLAIVVIHPQQFTGENYKELWDIYLHTIDWIKANGGTIIKLEPPTPETEYSIDPLQLSVGILIGIVSTLLVYAVATRSRGKRRQKTELPGSSALPSDKIVVSFVEGETSFHMR